MTGTDKPGTSDLRDMRQSGNQAASSAGVAMNRAFAPTPTHSPSFLLDPMVWGGLALLVFSGIVVQSLLTLPRGINTYLLGAGWAFIVVFGGSCHFIVRALMKRFLRNLGPTMGLYWLLIALVTLGLFELRLHRFEVRRDAMRASMAHLQSVNQVMKTLQLKEMARKPGTALQVDGPSVTGLDRASPFASELTIPADLTGPELVERLATIEYWESALVTEQSGRVEALNLGTALVPNNLVSPQGRADILQKMDVLEDTIKERERIEATAYNALLASLTAFKGDSELGIPAIDPQETDAVHQAVGHFFTVQRHVEATVRELVALCASFGTTLTFTNGKLLFPTPDALSRFRAGTSALQAEAGEEHAVQEQLYRIQQGASDALQSALRGYGQN